MKADRVLIAFVPVLHKGYLELFKKYPHVYILGEDIIAQYTSLTRDLRVVDPTLIKTMIESLGLSKEVRILNASDLSKIEATEIVMPDEDVSRDLAAKYFTNIKVTYESVFLRWDKIITLKELEVPADRVISEKEFDKEMITKALAEAKKSADWWRQIGAVVVKNDKVILSSFNKVLPNDFSIATFGDLRSNFDAGQHIDLVYTIHAEARTVATAAREGYSLEGASIYVTTFPCPPCAKLIREAGIKKLYYKKGYSLIDAEKLLKDAGVEIILVKD